VMVDTSRVQRHGFSNVEDRIVPGRLVEYPSAQEILRKEALNAGSRMILRVPAAQDVVRAIVPRVDGQGSERLSLRMRVALRSFSSVGFMSAARPSGGGKSEVSVGPGWVGSHAVWRSVPPARTTNQRSDSSPTSGRDPHQRASAPHPVGLIVHRVQLQAAW